VAGADITARCSSGAAGGQNADLRRPIQEMTKPDQRWLTCCLPHRKNRRGCIECANDCKPHLYLSYQAAVCNRAGPAHGVKFDIAPVGPRIVTFRIRIAFLAVVPQGCARRARDRAATCTHSVRNRRGGGIVGRQWREVSSDKKSAHSASCCSGIGSPRTSWGAPAQVPVVPWVSRSRLTRSWAAKLREPFASWTAPTYVDDLQQHANNCALRD
jgi:hypothetical protein